MSLPFPILSMRAALLLLVLCAVSAPHAARAQASLGDFVPFGSWWLHPTDSTLGIFYDGAQIRIDRDGDGGAESLFLRPTGQTGIPDAAIGSLRLTPTRTIVYAFGGTCQGDGTLVYFYRVPAFGNLLEPIRTSLCIPGPLQRVHFYDTGTCAFNGFGLECAGRLGVSQRRIALFLTTADELGFSNLVWIDLSTGDVSGPAFDFENGIGFIHVSPSGTQAFLQHDLELSTEADYRLIDLCPGTLGTVINPGGFPITNSSEVLSAEVSAASGAEITVEITNQSGVVRDTATFADCLDVTGACCFANGGCYDTGTAPNCLGGDFLGAGASCSECPAPVEEVPCCIAEADPACTLREASSCTGQGGTSYTEEPFCRFDLCPQPDPTLTLTGPESGTVGDVFAYQFSYSNQGGVVARNAQIEVQIPYGARDVVVTNGGELEGDTTLRWLIGDLPPGASGTVGFSFRLGCEDAYVYLQGLIGHGPTGGGTSYVPSNTIQFQAEEAPSASLGVATTTVPDQDPSLPGDELRHIITLTNPGANAVAGVQIGSDGQTSPTGVTYGNAQSFDRTLADGGGNVDAQSGGIRWTIDVPAGQSRTLEFATRIASCIPGGIRETRLNDGTSIAAFDACGQEIGSSAAPIAVAVERNLDLDVRATNLAPPQPLDAPAIQGDVQVTRPGAATQVRIALGSNTGAVLNGVNLEADLRGFQVTTPPSGPGVSWNAGTSTLSWSGSIPAGAPVSIDIGGNVSACRTELRLSGSSGPGCTDLYQTLYVAAIPEPPPGPWLAAFATQTDPFDPLRFETHVVRIDPDAPAVETMLCLPTEYPQSIAGGPDGSIWTTWLPSLRFNPSTLEFESILLDDLYDAGLDSVWGVTIDPVDGAAYYAGSHLDRSILTNVGSIIRRDPVTDLYAPYVEEESLQAFERIAADPAGSIAAVAGDGVSFSDRLLRVDPGAPPGVTFFDQVQRPVDVAIDRDGTYVVLESGFAPPSAVHDFDSDVPSSVEVFDLDAAHPSVFGWRAVEVDANGRIFAVPYATGLLAIDRGATTTTEAIFPIGPGSGPSFLDLAMVSLPAPEPAETWLAAASLASLGVLRRRRDRR
jgi:hypothetical protein